jgi:hypothetical protein
MRGHSGREGGGDEDDQPRGHACALRRPHHSGDPSTLRHIGRGREGERETRAARDIAEPPPAQSTTQQGAGGGRGCWRRRVEVGRGGKRGGGGDEKAWEEERPFFLSE